MALTKVGSGGIENVTNSANATFLTIDASEQITVASEGGAVTTSVQQGLAKSWLHFDGSGTPSIDDSLNIASITDAGTAQFVPTFTNNMGVSGGYTASGGSSWDSGGSTGAFISFTANSYATTGVQAISYRSDTYGRLESLDITLDYHGDLA